MKITKTNSGKYTTAIQIRDIDGHRHLKRFTGSTKLEVQTLATEYQSKHFVYIESNAFCDALSRFLESRREILSPSTLRAYRSHQRTLQGFERFMNTPLDRITSQQLQALSDQLRINRSQKTVKNIMGLVSSVMSNEGYRMPIVHIRKSEKFHANVPDSDTVSKVAAAAKGGRWECAFALACLGLRRGEIAAVRSSDLNGNILHVQHSLAYTVDCTWEEKGTKTKESDRYVPLPEHIADMIRKKGCAWDGSPNSMTCSFEHLLKRAGVEPFRLHDCRHFFASYCHDVLKLSDAQIMKLGGWSTDHVMKQIYIEAITDESKNAVNSIASLL